jgi:crotonobetainyl-CoA:carnitine CoA-transferase CaiB-like acyl-CoA transferase
VAEQQDGTLSGYRVLDLVDKKGAYCTKMLADLGADVIKIENPEGDPTRRVPPFAGDVPHQERSLYFLYRHANKRGITLNLEVPDGRSVFRKLVASADVLVETYPPGYLASLGLGYEDLKKVNPALIMASITEFGQGGPYRDCAPINLPGTPSYDAASLIAAISIVTALYMRGSRGKGQYIDTSVHECSRLGLYPWMVTMYSYNINPGSPPPPPEGRLGAAIYPVYPCKDGMIRVVALTPRQWDALVKVLGEPEVLRLPEWREFFYRIANANDLYALMLEFTTKYTMLELAERGREEGVPIAPIYDVSGFVNSPHTKARGFFVEVDHPRVGKYNAPGPPYKWKGTYCGIRRPAPCLGQHNEDIYCEELGLTRNDLATLRNAGAI